MITRNKTGATPRTSRVKTQGARSTKETTWCGTRPRSACFKRQAVDLDPGEGEAIAYLDGWVERTPYWDPPSCSSNSECASRTCSGGTCTKIKVCALDAKENQAWSPIGTADPLLDSCNDLNGSSRPGCGCGPNLNYCWARDVEPLIRASLRDQMERLIEDVTTGDLTYSQMLTTKRTYYNGPLYHWKRYLAQMTPLNQTFNRYFPGDAPRKNNIVFTDTELVAEQREKTKRPCWNSDLARVLAALSDEPRAGQSRPHHFCMDK